MSVKVLRWPAEARDRERYREMGVPRLLVLEGSCPPPPCSDVLEDWVRPPVGHEEVRARAAALQARALASIPTLDCSDIVRFGGHWIALSPIDVRLMRVLLDNYQCLVPREDLVAAIWPEGQPRRNALDLRVLRLRRRLLATRLTIRTVWRKGYLLDCDPGDTTVKA